MSEIDIAQHFLDYMLKRLQYLKEKAEIAISQVSSDDDLFALLDEKSNSIAIIMKHLAGNMRSRWTDFLITDGEKPERDRPDEFERSFRVSRDELLQIWDKGWSCTIEAISNLTPNDLVKEVQIREKKITVLEAITWQLSHYSQHVGQIIFLAKHFESKSWKWLTMSPKYRYKPTN